MQPLLTVGHGRLGADALVALLRGADVRVLVDVRRFPGSRRDPTVGRDHLAEALPAASVGYRWDERLGGRRSLSKGDQTDLWWTVDAFRAYAAHTRTPEFLAAMDELLEQAATTRTAVMCSEAVWWRCHRRLIADVAVVGRGSEVLHLMPDGKLRPHRPAEGARRHDDGLVVWDGGDLEGPEPPG